MYEHKLKDEGEIKVTLVPVILYHTYVPGNT